MVEVKDVEIPTSMQRAMARQAEAERERRAKVINAEGEFQASDPPHPARQVGDRGEFGEAGMVRWGVGQLVGPGQRIGDVGGEGAGLQRRQDVGAEGIAGHRRLGRAGAVAGEDPRVGGGVLLADDLDRREQVAQARGGQLLLLVQQVALGDQHQAVALGQLGQRLLHARQGLDRMAQHLAAGGQDVGDDPAPAARRRSAPWRSRSSTG